MLTAGQTAMDSASKMDFRSAMEHRRSYYGIAKKSTISDEKILELVEFAVRYTPSAFNSQSQMTAVLLDEKHDQLWDIVLESLRKVVPPAQFADTEAKINGFKAGYGTILYFNEDETTGALQAQLPLYADRFSVWAEQANGMLQFAIWNLLECEGMGASLQHYNPLIDDAVQAAFGLPRSWRLMAQMPFGTPTAEPAAKDFAPVSARVRRIETEAEADTEITCSAEYTAGCK